MVDTTPGTRSYFLHDFSDETVPCEPTLDGWAKWLAKPDLADSCWDGDAEYPINGSTYQASAILWSEDIIARKHEGRWTLSRPIAEGENFFGIRWGPGSGWDADSIISVPDAGNRDAVLVTELAEVLGDDDEISDGEEHIAVGRDENGWRVTFHEGPPPICTAQRSN